MELALYIVILLLFLLRKERLLISKENSNRIKGFLALFIIIHHCVQLHYAEASIFSCFKNAGSWICAIFFFISGYGMYSQEIKISQMTFFEFWKKRLIKLLQPFLIITIGYQIFSYFLGDNNLMQVITTFPQGFPENLLPFCWFIFALLYLYILTYWFAGKQKGILGLWVMIIVYILFMRYAFHVGTYWYSSVFAYGLGAICKKLDISFKLKMWRILTIVTLIITILFLMFFAKSLALHFLVCALSTIVFIYGSTNLSPRMYRYSPYMVSYEMYLFQGYSIFVLYKNFNGPFILYLFLVIGTTLIFSLAYNRISKYLIRFNEK